MLSVRMTEEDYKEILRMKSEMGIEWSYIYFIDKT